MTGEPKRFQFIVCKVLQREAYFCAARAKNVVDIVLMEQGLHDYPDKLRSEVQKVLDRTNDIQGRPYDAMLLGYGLCSNGIVGLYARIPIVVPRGHDCVTLLLGSKEKYQQYFDSHRGVYWYSPGWIESGKMPSEERFERLFNEYKEKYGEDNARYLLETEQKWTTEYHWATYVDWGINGNQSYKDYTKRCAKFFGWNYEEFPGDSGLMQRLLDGLWNGDEFLVVSPGEKIHEDLTNSGIIKAG